MTTNTEIKTLAEYGALRQLKHNDGSEGFVFAYDKAITDRYVAELRATLTAAQHDLWCIGVNLDGANEERAELRAALESANKQIAKYEARMLRMAQCAGEFARDACRVLPDSGRDAAPGVLHDLAVAAAERWSIAEFKNAKNIGAGGPGLTSECNDMERAARRAIAKLADAAQPTRQAAAVQSLTDTEITQAIAEGYEGGSMVSSDLGGTVRLHYQSAAEAENAFDAITKLIDAQIAAASAKGGA